MGIDTASKFEEGCSKSFQQAQDETQCESRGSSNSTKISTSDEKIPARMEPEETRNQVRDRLASQPLNKQGFPMASKRQGWSAARPLSLKEQIKGLEPINEIPFEKVDKIIESVSGPFTESELQEVLLSYTYTSGMIVGGSNMNSALKTKDGTPLKSRLRKKWTTVALGAVDVIDKLQSKVYEYFWLCALYLNVCFPKLTTFFRPALRRYAL